MQLKTLDFIVIGASKSGTTTLFQYLRQHPGIFLPSGKDVPFFASRERFDAGWQATVQEFYAGAPVDAVWGAVTPRYMEDAAVPGRIRRIMPEAKLVALLRNPIDRAFSQYRQQVRRTKETRSFAEAIDEQLRAERLAVARNGESGALQTADTYLVRGEYGRILGDFRAHFPAEQLLVVFTDELEERPLALIGAVLEFLGMEPGFEPSNLGRRYHVGGTRQRFPRLMPTARRIAPLRAAWHLLPAARRQAIRTWFFTQANVVPEAAGSVDEALRKRLGDFFRPDVERLEALIGRSTPWEEFRDLG